MVIIPFEYFNSSEYEKYFAEGLTNQITNLLSLQEKFNVFPPSVISKHKGSELDLNQIGEEFGAKYVLKGTLEKNEGKISLDLKLYKAKKNKIIWETTINDSDEDILLFGNKIFLELKDRFKLKSSDTTTNFFSPQNDFNSQAFNIYLKGDYILNEISKSNGDPWKIYFQGKYYFNLSLREGNELAIRLFTEAIAVDNNFAHAYIALADCYSNYVNFGWENKIVWLEKAEDLVKKANTISSGLPEYYSSLARIYLIMDVGFEKKTKDLAFELTKKGIEKYPNDSQINALIGYCYYLKFSHFGNEEDLDNAITHCERSFLIEPYSIRSVQKIPN